MQKKLTLITLILAFVVIVVGAYTRLTDAGLGCPDWPGCYGQVLAPTSQDEIQSANMVYPDTPVDVTKAWTEMVHRYIASTLGALILIITLIANFSQQATREQKWLTRGMLALVIFQGMLGMWTVTLKLFPLVVMSHLLGGLLTLSMLWMLWHMQSTQPTTSRMSTPKPWALVCAGALFVQIALGGWTSTNYAALSCPAFPLCTDVLLPSFDWKAFNFYGALAYEDPLQFMNIEARQTIHMLHRLGAFIVTALLLALSYKIYKYKQANPESNRLTVLNLTMIGLLTLQVILGVTNVLAILPLSIAVAHNATAVLLLLLLLHLYFILPKHHVANH